MFTVVAAPNAFKGSASAAEVCRCVERAARRVSENIRVVSAPMADGGDGTAEVLRVALKGHWQAVTVCGPLGTVIRSKYVWCPGDRIAVIEMALASGLALLRPEQRNPLLTTTFGTGQLIADALRIGADRILLAVGGSATVDGGAGALQALGARFHNQRGILIEEPIAGGTLSNIGHVDLSELNRNICRVKIEVVCDVRNPLHGAMGAARVFGPQKGATPSDVKILERGLTHFAKTVCKAAGKDLSLLSRAHGAGAAGGLAFGLLAGCGARIRPGARLVGELIGLEELIVGCDLVISGEGAVDTQSFMGKVPDEVARLTRKHRKRLVLLGGTINLGIRELQRNGVCAAFPIVRGPASLEDAIRHAPQLIAETAANVLRVMTRR